MRSTPICDGARDQSGVATGVATNGARAVFSGTRADTTPSPTPLSDTSRIVVSKDQVSCLAGEAAIVNLKNGVYYGLDPVGARIWNLIREPVTFAHIRDSLVEDYDVEPGRAEADIREFLTRLAEQGLVEISS